MSTPRKNPPSANILMNSIRSIGYTFESAIADIIDNSISAESKNIQIYFPTDPRCCFVRICDDGKGMSLNALYEAMKYGSTVEGNKRSEDDLGRFGLGLKSASLSQCRKLTVISKKDNIFSGFIWDLDYINEDNDDWWIQEMSQEEILSTQGLNWFEGKKQGTIVVWENFDTIEKTSGDVFYALYGSKEKLSDYLQLIFHRYLNDDKDNKISIRINEYELVGFDPFLEKFNHKKTTNLREIQIPINDSEEVEQIITVKPFVLPFQKDLTETDIKKIGGMENYQTGQGFYVYRRKRLIIWGTWFRMKQRYELTKHARIRVDIPNTLDDIWCIDIKKQSAALPPYIKNQLVKAVESVMNTALKVQKFRGRPENLNDKISYIWDRCNTEHKQQLNGLVNFTMPAYSNSRYDSRAFRRLNACASLPISGEVHTELTVKETAQNRLDWLRAEMTTIDTQTKEIRREAAFWDLEALKDGNAKYRAKYPDKYNDYLSRQ